MLHKKHSTWIAVSAAVLMAGCATTGASLHSSAERLDRAAYNLTRETRYGDERHDYRRDAQEFASEAHDFRRVVDSRDSRSEDVRKAFRDLSERYHALRDEEREGAVDRRTKDDFSEVTEAYLDVEREVKGERYARD